MMPKLQLLFLPSVDTDDVNAQSLNTREICLRLDPERFQSTLWYEREPDPRLLQRQGIRLLQLPPRRKTVSILQAMLAGHDLIAYMDCSPASYLFLRLPHAFRARTKTVFHAEAPSTQMVNPTRVFRFLNNGVAPHCDAYTAITEFVARDVKASLHRQPEHILPVGVDTRFFKPPLERSNPSPVVLFAGTLIERKGPQLILDAAARFPTAYIRLVGAGRDGFEDVLRRRIAQSALTNVRLEGPKSQSELLQIMRESDIFLLPSRLKGIPKVTLEAAATGLPCVVFRDYETRTLRDLLAERGRQTVLQNPTLAHQAERLLAVYWECC